VNACVYKEIYDKLFKHIKNIIPEKNHFARETTDIPKNSQ
jgi:hypothetical protein